MLPYSTLIPLRRDAAATLSQQIATAFIQLIQQGLLPAQAPLPGTRTLAGLLAVHRQTVVVAFEELEAQGWIQLRSSKGAFVSSRIPEVKAQPFQASPARQVVPRAGFTYEKPRTFPTMVYHPHLALVLDAGTPDSRLAPLASLARKYRTVCQRPSHRSLFGYTAPNGSLALRQQLAHYLQDTRGVPAQAENIFITRGGVMSLYLLVQLLVRMGDTVVVGQRSYYGADQAFAQQGAHVQRVRVDEHGLCVDEVEALCRRQAVRLLYVTPHHHYPTTVTLSAERRVRLLQLAEQYDFIVLEDDYDFDFHYDGSPILPLASTDRGGRVLYMGSLSKVLAPAFRVGYVVAPADIVAELSHLRRYIDHQGDTVLEQGVAELFAEGEMRAHLKRARKIYQQRRDVFCHLLREQLPEYFTFAAPAGGMAVWGQFHETVNLASLARCCSQLGLGLSDGQPYQTAEEPVASHVRLGFASMNSEELTQSVSILAAALQTVAPMRH